MLGAKMVRPPTKSLAELIDHFKMLPATQARWCTRIIKIQSALAWTAQLEQPVEMIVGLRADEENRAGIYSNEVESRYPLREWEWGIYDVLTYLAKRGVIIPRRTDCARCPYQRIGEWWDLWKDHPNIYDSAVQDEARVSAWRKKPCTFRGPGRDTWPVGLADLRVKFEAGHIPIRASVQTELFDEPQRCRVCRM
jgi:hypothetical protein